MTDEATVDVNRRVMVHEPHGWIRLEKYNASDLDVVNAARVSFAQRSKWMEDKDIGLLNYLMRNGHTSTFEHGSFTFVIRAPIFVAREWMRHRTFSYNEQSTRYMEMEPDFYTPDASRMRSQVGKPGHYEMVPLDKGNIEPAQAEMASAFSYAYEVYQQLLCRGVAKEVARNVLPFSLYTQFWATANPLNLMRFLSLRNHPSALREIRDYAEVVEQIFSVIMPVTHTAFVKTDRFGMANNL